MSGHASSFTRTASKRSDLSAERVLTGDSAFTFPARTLSGDSVQSVPRVQGVTEYIPK